MKCTRKDCSNEAEYIVDGQSICKDHRDNKESAEGSMGDLMTGKLEL